MKGIANRQKLRTTSPRPRPERQKPKTNRILQRKLAKGTPWRTFSSK